MQISGLATEETRRASATRRLSTGQSNSGPGDATTAAAAIAGRGSAVFKRPTGFRAGIMSMLIGKGGDLESTTGTQIVAAINGDVNETFNSLDANGDGRLDTSELKQLLVMLGGGAEGTEAQVAELVKAIGADREGCVGRSEFKKWYVKSEARLQHRCRQIFDQIDGDGDGTLTEDEVLTFVRELATTSGRVGDPAAAAAEFHAAVGAETCDFDRFQKWYQATVFWKRDQDDAELAAEASEPMWDQVVDSLVNIGERKPLERVMVIFLLPINASLGLTVPDCRKEDREWYCYGGFVMSIGWIFAYTRPAPKSCAFRPSPRK